MITKEDVVKIAKLARLELTKEEIERYQKDLSSILEYAKKLDEVDTEGVEPLYQVTGLEHVVREDVAVPQPDEKMQKLLEASQQGEENNQFLVKNVL